MLYIINYYNVGKANVTAFSKIELYYNFIIYMLFNKDFHTSRLTFLPNNIYFNFGSYELIIKGFFSES